MTTTNLPISQEAYAFAEEYLGYGETAGIRGEPLRPSNMAERRERNNLAQAFQRAMTQADAAGYRRGVDEEAARLNKLGRDANALFRLRLGKRTRPTWFAVNALQDAVQFCELYLPAIRALNKDQTDEP